MSQIPLHPIQPLVKGERGVLRYKSNAIVEFLLRQGPFRHERLGRHGFSREDREQFAQLIGYSHSGAGELSYFSDEVWECSKEVFDNPGKGSSEALLRGKLDQLRNTLRGPISDLYGIHPDDLGEP